MAMQIDVNSTSRIKTVHKTDPETLPLWIMKVEI